MTGDNWIVTVTDRAPDELEERLATRLAPWSRRGILLPPGARALHIGPHKTGTTAVQASLHAARADLERQGVYYASEGRHAMTAALAALQLPDPWSDEREPPQRWKWERVLAMIRRTKADRVVIGSEFYSDGEPTAIKRLVDELDPARIHIVVTLRPIARIIPSQWQQWVQNLWTMPLDTFVRDLLEKPEGQAGGPFWRRHRHDLLIRRWAEIVGPERVTAIALDGDHEMVLRGVRAPPGLELGTLHPVTSITNRSMTLTEIEVIRAFNHAYKTEKLSRRLYTRVMRFGASTLMESRPPSLDEPKIELPAWSPEPIQAIERQIIDGVRSSGVRIVGTSDTSPTCRRRAGLRCGRDCQPGGRGVCADGRPRGDGAGSRGRPDPSGIGRSRGR